MIKVATILLGVIIVVGITMTIFAGCDPMTREIPSFSSGRGEGKVEKGFLDGIQDFQCGLSKPSKSPQQAETLSPSASPTLVASPSLTEAVGGSKKRLKAVFSFWENPDGNYGNVNGSLRKSFKIEITNNNSNEDLFDWLPMQVVLKADNRRVWENYITKESCNEYLHRQYCTVPFYKYDPVWDGKKLLMQLYAKDGELLEVQYEE